VEAKTGRIRRVKCWAPRLAILALLSTSVALAEDFKTINGKEYKDATVIRVEADGIVLRTKSGIVKLYFSELPKEVQERFDGTKTTAAATPHQTSMREAGDYGLSPITVGLKDEILNALKMTDNLDALYKRGCTSAEFIAAATPIEGVFINFQNKLPKGDPGRDLLANTFGAYQQAAVAMIGHERGRGQRPDATIAVAELRKHLLRRVLQGDMTPEEEKVYYAWRKAANTNP
jgi:hypothetical protein